MFRRACIFAVTAVLGISAATWAQTAGSISDKFARAAARQRASSRGGVSPVQRLMRTRVEKVDWVEITFQEVLDWLRGISEDRVNIVPRWTALNAEGVDTDSPVTLQLKGTTVAMVLNEVLSQISEDDQVIYRGEGNMLRISSKDDFNRKLEFRIYDVTDILFNIPDMARNAPMIDLQQASRASSGGGGGGRGVFRGGSSGQAEELEDEEQETEERMEELRTMIYSVIAPETWEEGGGGRGKIEVLNDRTLIVLNTIEVHELLSGFFERGR